MKITKFEHACFVVEQNGQSLVVDPGGFTTDFIVPENVVAVVITHEHQDHLDPHHIAAIIDKNPDATVIGHQDVLKDLNDYQTRAVVANEGTKVGEFALEFYGGQHAIIDPAIPVIANLGVMINNTLYYPGDSFVEPKRAIKVLALPVAAPWMKLSEAADFVRQLRPALAFPTHDAILSDSGKALADRLIPSLTGVEYTRLKNSRELL